MAQGDYEVNGIRIRADGAVYVTGDGDAALTDLSDATDVLKGDYLVGVKLDAVGSVARTQHDKNAETISVTDFGAVGDGVADDVTALQAAIDGAGDYGTLLFPKTTANLWLISSALKFRTGQTWTASGGLDVSGAGPEIRLTAASTSVAEPHTPSSTKFGVKFVGIYFNAQGNADYGLSLYNCSYCDVDQCAFNTTKAGGAGLLLDSDTTLSCYFNTIRSPRVFGSGVGGCAIRFQRGANVNLVFGGKCGSSTGGMEFLTSSSGNVIIGTDFENNTGTSCHVDAPSNTFIGTHMESSVSGFVLTANAINTGRIGCTYASSVTTQITDAALTGSVVDTRTDGTSTKGDLRFGAATFLSEILSTVTRLDYDPELSSGTAQALVRMFLNINTSGAKSFTIYKGDGTATLAFSVNAATGEVTMGDLNQDNGAGTYRRIVRRNVAPSAGASAWSRGDIWFTALPSASGHLGEVCTSAGSPGTWVPFGFIGAVTGKDQKAIYGLTYLRNVADATNDIDISAGGAMDATGAYFMTGAALTKRSDAAWAVGNAAGGLDLIGSAGDNEFHIWLIARSDTGVVDYLFSLSSTAPTMPANYDFKRLVGWFRRGGGAILSFTTYETPGGGLEYLWMNPTLDVDLANTLTTTRRTDAVKVPLNFSTIAHLNFNLYDAAGQSRTWIYCPDQADLAPSITAAPLANVQTGDNAGAGARFGQLYVRTSATGTIAARSDVATMDEYKVSTLGFLWARRN